VVKSDNKENRRTAKVEQSDVKQAVFEAHKEFITSCVGQLEVHTHMLNQAQSQPDAGLHDYVVGLERLLTERQAALGALQRQLQTFRASVSPGP